MADITDPGKQGAEGNLLLFREFGKAFFEEQAKCQYLFPISPGVVSGCFLQFPVQQSCPLGIHVWHVKRGGLAGPDVVFQDAINGAETVFPTYFLAFFIAAAVIGNAHFIDAHIGNAAHFGRDLGLKSESFFL